MKKPALNVTLAGSPKLALSAMFSMGLLIAASSHAQSSVTIYGIIDAGVSRANNGTTALLSRGMADTWVVKQGNGSRLGFRGYEDMGGGLYARFQLEHRFTTDTGAPNNANVFWLGRSVVAVGSNSLGEIYGGREFSPAFWVALEADPTYWSYVSQLGQPYTYANYTPVPATVEASAWRWSNAVGYKSPSLGGLTVELQGAAGENLRKTNRAGNIMYKSGPVWLGAAFDRLDSKTNLTLIGGGYDFGVARPTFSYAQAKGGLNGDAKSFSLGLKVPVSYGRVLLMAGRYMPASHLNSTMFGATTEYDLSKRTLLYASLASAKQDSKTRSTAIDFGIKHTF